MVLEFISSITPLLAFILVTVLVYALLQATKILGDKKVISLIIAIIIGLLFIIVPNSVEFTNTVFPIIAGLIVFIAVTLLIVAFAHGSTDIITKGVTWVIVIVVIIIFLFAAIKVSPQFQELITNPTHFWKNMVFTPVIFFVIFGIVAWLFVKK